MSIVKNILNLELKDYVRDYFFINNILEISQARKLKDKEPLKVSLNDSNSIFVNVEQIQLTMVELYSLTPKGLYIMPIL